VVKLFNIFKIEKEYKKGLSNIKEWNYLRNYYREANFNRKSNSINKINKIEALKSVFYGFKNWFKRYDYLIFSSSDARKELNNIFYDVRSDYIAEILNQTLIVETPNPTHYKNISTKYIVSRRMIDLFTIVGELFLKIPDRNNVIDDINERFNINIDYRKIIKRFNIQYKIYKIWFKVIKPKLIFINCYYDKQYIVKAAHDIGIKVVDIQHGLIGKEHSAYYSSLNLDRKFLPDYLFVFTEQDKNNLIHSLLFEKSNIYVVGNYYLEIIKRNFNQDKNLCSIIEPYKLTIGVSLQWTIENDLIEFLISLAKNLPDTLFILIPRVYEEKKYKNFNLPKNIMFYPSLDCYSIIMHCNYHCTVYSTCAEEAASLKIPTILIDINGLSRKYFTVQDEIFILPKSIKAVITFIRGLPKEKNNNQTFQNDNNYTKNIKKALKNIGCAK